MLLILLILEAIAVLKTAACPRCASEWQDKPIEILVKDSNVTLISPQFGGGFADMRPAQLLRKMSQAGLHLTPQDVDAEVAGTRLKEHAADSALAHDMALLISACGCSFTSCAYNRRASGPHSPVSTCCALSEPATRTGLSTAGQHQLAFRWCMLPGRMGSNAAWCAFVF